MQAKVAWHLASYFITLVEGYFSLNYSGICSFTFSLDGHISMSLNLRCTKFTQVMISLLIVVWEIPYK